MTTQQPGDQQPGDQQPGDQPDGGRPMEILLVEDNPADVMLTRQGLQEACSSHSLHVARDGVEAMAFLRQEEPYQDAPRPDLILLDLNMPIKNGFEVLDEIKATEQLKAIPVVILTTSDDPQDIRTAYQKYASSYLTKPVSFDQFVSEVAKGIGDYWFKLVKLPSHEEP